MKKLIFIFLSVLVISFLSSCKKEVVNPYEGRVVVEGHVRQMGIKKGVVPNAVVVLYSVTGEALGNTEFIPRDSTISDINGFYHFDTPAAANDWIYDIQAFAPKYYQNSYAYRDENIAPSGLAPGKSHKSIYDVGLKPYSWVRVNVKNISPSDDNESILIGVTNHSGSDEFYKGTDVEETFIREIIGNDSTSISWRIQNKFDYTYGKSESKFVGTHDTIIFNINY
jgi:hypothetical protein